MNKDYQLRKTIFYHLVVHSNAISYFFDVPISRRPPDILPPSSHRSARSRKRQSRLMHLASAPVCLWQHVLRKSHQSHDHLPRVMPPALRPMETRIFHRMRLLIDSVLNMDNVNNPIPSSASQLTWKHLFVILNACKFFFFMDIDKFVLCGDCFSNEAQVC